ncbi:hypothetical protein GSI_13563 [Ganoderma sinense ZZ0214-1]|uniref:Uncharacterized protein n=1 Tax=Ganoderma sinense ZZ0214-1 TaxID=1077348 RepID=A0A2G8RQN7_9APHY|nr:hypothetical protein GSI_13563 [Ganoderma sinense ZZ0214-1]
MGKRGKDPVQLQTTLALHFPSPNLRHLFNPLADVPQGLRYIPHIPSSPPSMKPIFKKKKKNTKPSPMACEFCRSKKGGQLVAEPGNQVPQHNFYDRAATNGTYAHLPSLAIDTSMMATDTRESVTPSSGPSSPRSYWETVLNQEYSVE